MYTGDDRLYRSGDLESNRVKKVLIFSVFSVCRYNISFGMKLLSVRVCVGANKLITQ